jgi:hypothetical protein
LDVARTPWQSCGLGLFPLAIEFQKDIRIMRKGVRGKQRKRSV